MPCSDTTLREHLDDDDDDEKTKAAAATVTSPVAAGGGKNNIVGDPIELAALKGIEWTWDAATSTATPGSWCEIRLHYFVQC